jgi:hypothetical protein
VFQTGVDNEVILSMTVAAIVLSWLKYSQPKSAAQLKFIKYATNFVNPPRFQLDFT